MSENGEKCRPVFPKAQDDAHKYLVLSTNKTDINTRKAEHIFKDFILFVQVVISRYISWYSKIKKDGLGNILMNQLLALIYLRKLINRYKHFRSFIDMLQRFYNSLMN